MRYIDTHTHVNLSAFDDDREEVILRSLEAGVSMVNVGTKQTTSERAVDIARAHDNCYATVGLHPIQSVPGHHDEKEVGEGATPFTSKGEVFDVATFRALASDPKVIAIGECGLDYYHTTPESEALQREAFIAQIHLANELQKPLMLHIRNGTDGRNAYKDVADIIKREATVRGNAHFFAGSVDDARRFLDMGYSVSFTGVVTFTRDYDEVVRFVPEDMIHAETDAPYVAPKPYRGKRNEPAYVIEVIKKLAEIRNTDEREFEKQLLKNWSTLYSVTR